MVGILLSFFFEAYKRLVYLFIFFKYVSKKEKLNNIHSLLKILDYNVLACRLVYNNWYQS